MRIISPFTVCTKSNGYKARAFLEDTQTAPAVQTHTATQRQTR